MRCLDVLEFDREFFAPSVNSSWTGRTIPTLRRQLEELVGKSYEWVKLIKKIDETIMPVHPMYKPYITKPSSNFRTGHHKDINQPIAPPPPFYPPHASIYDRATIDAKRKLNQNPHPDHTSDTPIKATTSLYNPEIIDLGDIIFNYPESGRNTMEPGNLVHNSGIMDGFGDASSSKLYEVTTDPTRINEVTDPLPAQQYNTADPKQFHSEPNDVALPNTIDPSLLDINNFSFLNLNPDSLLKINPASLLNLNPARRLDIKRDQNVSLNPFVSPVETQSSSACEVITLPDSPSALSSHLSPPPPAQQPSVHRSPI